MNGLDIILLLKSGAKLRLFFETCKCLSNNFLKYFWSGMFCFGCYRGFGRFCCFVLDVSNCVLDGF